MGILLNICFCVAVVCVALLLMICVWKALWDWCDLDVAFSSWAEGVRERRRTRREMRFVIKQVEAIGYEMVEDKPYPVGLSGTFWCYSRLEKPTLRRGTLKCVNRSSWIGSDFPSFEIKEEGKTYGSEFAFGVRWDEPKDEESVASND